MTDRTLAFDQCIAGLSRFIKHGGDTLKSVPTALKLVLGDNLFHEPMWPERYCEVLGEVVKFRTYVEFVEASQPRGLGTSIEMLKNICHDDQLARDLIDEAVRNPALNCATTAPTCMDE